jgi:hypothetical protein
MMPPTGAANMKANQALDEVIQVNFSTEPPATIARCE